MDPEGIQGTRDSYSCQAREESESVEGQGKQKVQSVISYVRVQPKAQFPRQSESRGGTRGARSRELLAPQIPGDLRDAVSVGGCRSPHRSTMAWSFRHGEHDALPQAFAQPACACEGE